MDLILPLAEQYAAAHTSAEEALLKELNAFTRQQHPEYHMLSGHLQGKFLEMISCMIRPGRVLEIGTFTGYSALCMAEGLQEGGKLTTIDINEELTPMVREAIQEAQMQDRIQLMTGNALDIIPTLQGPFDMVFIDADKQNYARYFDLVIEKVPIGGHILADNVLWSGRVTDAQKDKDTLAIDAFNKKVAADPRVEQVILSVRDGITLMRRVS